MHASIPFKTRKVRNLWIFLCWRCCFLSDLYEFQFQSFLFLMRTFFSRSVFLPGSSCRPICMHFNARLLHRLSFSFLPFFRCKFVGSVRWNEFSNSCTISVQELPVSNHFINDFDLSNESSHRRIVHHLQVPCAFNTCMDTINFAWKFLHNRPVFVVFVLQAKDDEKGKISSMMIMCVITKVSDNYPGQGHEIISFFTAHSKAIHHRR